MLKSKKIILFHALYWILTLVDVSHLSYLIAAKPDAPFSYFVTQIFFKIPDQLLFMGFFYLHLLIWIPSCFRKKQYFKYLGYLTLSILLLYLPVRYFIEDVFFRWIGGSGLAYTYKSFWIVDSTTGALRLAFMAVAYYLTWQWIIGEREKKELMEQKLLTELSFLKNQLNPHFLFNTLSNIYSLAYTKSSYTPEAVMKLSDMMRYMLYDSNEAEVSLQKEIQYIYDYIDLQKMRTDKTVYIEFSVENITDNIKIAPLLFIPFIENIFKHGVIYSPSNPAVVSLIIKNNTLQFKSLNTKSGNEKDKSVGIGVLNTKRRLELIYGNRHSLTINNLPTSFEVLLSIQLKND